MGRLPLWVLFGLTLFAVSFNDEVYVRAEVGPTESECRPYIERAINELKTGDADHKDGEESAEGGESTEAPADGGTSTEADQDVAESGEQTDEGKDSGEGGATLETVEVSDGDASTEEAAKSEEGTTEEEAGEDQKSEEDTPSAEQTDEPKSGEEDGEKSGEQQEDDTKSGETEDEAAKSGEDAVEDGKSEEDTVEDAAEGETQSGEAEAAESGEQKEEEAASQEVADQTEENKSEEDAEQQSEEKAAEAESAEGAEGTEEADDGVQSEEQKDDGASEEVVSRSKRSVEEDEPPASAEETVEASADEAGDSQEAPAEDGEESTEAAEDGKDSTEDEATTAEDDGKDSTEDAAEASQEAVTETDEDSKEAVTEDKDSKEDVATEEESAETKADDDGKDSKEDAQEDTQEDEGDSKEQAKEEAAEGSQEVGEASGEAASKEAEEGDDSEETKPEDELLWEGEIPENLRDRKHISELLHLDDDYEDKERAVDRVAEIILRDIKKIYENAIKPLETLYKYRDLSNRHFSDPEIFSKPLVLFMGPWSGGKSSIINYLTDNEFKTNSLRTGAEPSPAYFNILMWGNETEVLDGTQLAADYTFSGLQKFGQGLEERLRGLKMPSKLLEKVNIVEIPGILEVRKQVSRLFPFNDACQWFIDRADIIFLVYDPAKLDVGPETEAILDQLKGREFQTRIVLNKADTVHPEELLRVQSALIWNISPLMSSAQPPTIYTTSLWSRPYEHGSPVRLLQAQERAMLRDLRTAVDKRIEHKIASARRFAVRVRNHAKMVDCYLTTFYNHKTLFANKKRVADQIIDNPQNYHIYEGLSTLTNISRYDLPDPEVYRDFFRLNPLYEFKKLSETCTYFRGCPITKLDIAIAYDLPELAGKYKKMAETALANIESPQSPSTHAASTKSRS